MLDPKQHWDTAREMALEAAASSPPETSVAFFTFTDRVEDRVEFGDGLESIRAKLKTLENTRSRPKHAALLDVLGEVIPTFSQPRPGDAIYIITDADQDYSTRQRDRDVHRQLMALGIRVFVAIMHPQYQHSLLGVTEKSLVQVPGESLRYEEIAIRTGGGSFHLFPDIFGHFQLSPGTFSDEPVSTTRGRSRLVRYPNFLTQVYSFYNLKLEGPWTDRDPAKWTVTIVDDHDKRRNEFQVLYPSLLFPCELPAH